MMEVAQVLHPYSRLEEPEITRRIEAIPASHLLEPSGKARSVLRPGLIAGIM